MIYRNSLHPDLAIVLIIAFITGCTAQQPTPDRIATGVAEAKAIAATMTAQAPTVTSTINASPTPTSTMTLPPTKTDASGNQGLSSTDSTPMPEGWSKHTTSEFEIWLPEKWEEWEITPETYPQIIINLKQYAPALAQHLESMMNQPGALETMKLFAYDKGSSGSSMNIVEQDLPPQFQGMPISLGMMMPQFEQMYKQMGMQNISTESGLEINGMDAARVDVDFPMNVTGFGKVTLGMTQYLILSDERMYAITFSDMKRTAQNKVLFEQIMKSFRVIGK